MASQRAIKRPDADREADGVAKLTVRDELQAIRDDLRAALRALPAPASRTAAQRRDALILRASILTIRSQLINWGVGTAADRDNSDV